jgi:hypothetical protein
VMSLVSDADGHVIIKKLQYSILSIHLVFIRSENFKHTYLGHIFHKVG